MDVAKLLHDLSSKVVLLQLLPEGQKRTKVLIDLVNILSIAKFEFIKDLEEDADKVINKGGK